MELLFTCCAMVTVRANKTDAHGQDAAIGAYQETQVY